MFTEELTSSLSWVHTLFLDEPERKASMIFLIENKRNLRPSKSLAWAMKENHDQQIHTLQTALSFWEVILGSGIHQIGTGHRWAFSLPRWVEIRDTGGDQREACAAHPPVSCSPSYCQQGDPSVPTTGNGVLPMEGQTEIKKSVIPSKFATLGAPCTLKPPGLSRHWGGRRFPPSRPLSVPSAGIQPTSPWSQGHG